MNHGCCGRWSLQRCLSGVSGADPYLSFGSLSPFYYFLVACIEEAGFGVHCDSGDHDSRFHRCNRNASVHGMIEKKVKIRNKFGLHARPAVLFVRTAAQFASDIFLLKDGLQVNGKSTMGVMTLAAACGSEITIRANGPDKEAAIEALVALIQSKFEEK